MKYYFDFDKKRARLTLKFDELRSLGVLGLLSGMKIIEFEQDTEKKDKFLSTIVDNDKFWTEKVNIWETLKSIIIAFDDMFRDYGDQANRIMGGPK